MNETKDSEVIVCLGQALLPGAKASAILHNRCDKAVELHLEKGCHIINTGGDPAGVGVTESRVMTEYMTNVKGLPNDAIIEEGEAKTTLENAVFVKRILEKMDQVKKDDCRGGVTTLCLVTSPHHMIRSSYIFKAVFAFHNYNIQVVEEASLNTLDEKVFKQWLAHEKRIVENHITLYSTSAVMGSRGGHNIPVPDKEVLHKALTKINAMLESAESSGSQKM